MSQERTPTPREGSQLLAKFSRKLHENEENCAGEGQAYQFVYVDVLS